VGAVATTDDALFTYTSHHLKWAWYEVSWHMGPTIRGVFAKSTAWPSMRHQKRRANIPQSSRMPSGKSRIAKRSGQEIRFSHGQLPKGGSSTRLTLIVGSQIGVRHWSGRCDAETGTRPPDVMTLRRAASASVAAQTLIKPRY